MKPKANTWIAATLVVLLSLAVVAQTIDSLSVTKSVINYEENVTFTLGTSTYVDHVVLGGQTMDFPIDENQTYANLTVHIPDLVGYSSVCNKTNITIQAYNVSLDLAATTYAVGEAIYPCLLKNTSAVSMTVQSSNQTTLRFAGVNQLTSVQTKFSAALAKLTGKNTSILQVITSAGKVNISFVPIPYNSTDSVLMHVCTETTDYTTGNSSSTAQDYVDVTCRVSTELSQVPPNTVKPGALLTGSIVIVGLAGAYAAAQYRRRRQDRP